MVDFELGPAVAAGLVGQLDEPVRGLPSIAPVQRRPLRLRSRRTEFLVAQSRRVSLSDFGLDPDFSPRRGEKLSPDQYTTGSEMEFPPQTTKS